ncbi:MAG: YidC/Oxa1 family membrane protein insertase [Oscillospiraceae bacterium]|nr:YidC/Oxa1 family membrane protein insertase [Oscillospiraceae bacterium]MCL2279597.1 YidC/Oxa1 family membrane protein insertase [Oscillospiraceae bacterium]
MFNAIAAPFGMLLMWLYELVNNYALSLILIAILVRILLLPFQMKGKRGQLRMSRLNPKMDELRKKHAANKQKLNEETAKLYREEGINPASGCLWNFIQMPIMLALFWAIRQPITVMMRVAEGFIYPEPFTHDGVNYATGPIYQRLVEAGYQFVEGGQATWEQIFQTRFMNDYWYQYNFNDFVDYGLRRMDFSLGMLDLGQVPEWQVWNFDWSDSTVWLPLLLLFFFPVLSCGAQFISAAVMRKTNPMATPAEGTPGAGSMGTMMKFMPLMSLVFGFMFPAALAVYWTTGTVLQIGQDLWLNKRYTRILDAEDAEKEKIRKEKEAVLEAKRLETERKKAEGIIEENKNKSKRKKQKGSKQARLEKAAEWEKKISPKKKDRENENKHEPSRIGNRRYARGRAYDPDRYSKGSATSETGELLDDDSLAIDVADDFVDLPDSEIADTDSFPDDDYFEEDESDDYEDDDDFEDDYEDDDDDYDDEEN